MNKATSLQQKLNQLLNDVHNIQQQIKIIETEIKSDDNGYSKSFDELDKYAEYLCLTAKTD